jgi:hypothetical protein
MEIGGVSSSALTPSAISQSKQAQTAQNAEVRVLKKKLDSEGTVESKLIESATEESPAPGKGKLLDVSA